MSKLFKIASPFLILALVLSLVMVAVPMASPAEASPDTDVSGTINSDTTWNMAGSPYNFTGDVTVASGVTLTIEPGVTINLNGFSLIVNGVLDARGTEGNMITFSNNPHIKLSGSGSDNSILSYCNISSESNWPLIEFDDSEATVEHSNIWFTSTSTHRAVVKVRNGASPTIQYNTIKGDSSLSLFFPGVKSSDAYEILVDDGNLDGLGCNPTIVGNTIDGDASGGGGTSESGILITNGNDAADVSTATITGNTIKNHRDSGSSGPYGAYAGIEIREGCSATISCNTIDNNIHGIFLEGSTRPGQYSTATIEGNTIKNGDCGIYAVLLYTPLTAHCNNIYGNALYGVYMFTPSMDAEYNWWGNVNGPSDPLGTEEMPQEPEPAVANMLNAEPVGDLGNGVSDNVDYYPWLEAPYRPTTPMASFTIDHAKIDFKKKADDDKLHVKGKLALDLAYGDGVNISEDVTVTVGTLSETIKMEEKGKNGEKWEYKRPKDGDGNIKHMTINWKSGKFDIRMDKADLTGLTDPEVTISIQIGDDLGEETITMTVKKHHWDYKA